MSTGSVTPIEIETTAVRKILVCQLRQIGDVILSTPAISLLRQRFPNAEIHVMTMKINKQVLSGNPDINRLWLIDRKEHKSLFKQVGFYLAVASERFDIIVDFQQLPRIRNVVALSRFFKPESGKQIRLTFTPPWYNRLFYTHTVDMLKGYAAMAKASVLRPLGIEWDGEKPRMFFTGGEMSSARATLADLGVSEDDFLVTVDPSHRRATRRWSAENYGKLAALAAKEHKDLKFIVFYGPDEEEDAARVAKAANTPAVIVPEEMFSIRDMAAIIKCADLHIGNCSAPRHIAVAVGTPTLVVLGSTGSAWTFPSPEHSTVASKHSCRPCNENTCPKGTNACLKELAPEAVLPDLLSKIREIQGENS